MYEQKKEILFQFGRQKNLAKHKKQEVLTMTEESAIISAADSLYHAEEIARLTNDTELLLAISDRWLNLSKYLTIDESPNRIGFLTLEEEDDDRENYSEGFDTSKSRFKIRKKSRDTDANTSAAMDRVYDFVLAKLIEKVEDIKEQLND
jgi:hypothetical protein